MVGQKRRLASALSVGDIRGMTRSEAIRRLVEIGLKAKGK
jgi:hypothetical protein